MATKVYGASDDLIEIDGDVRGEVGYYGSEEKGGALVVCDDGTILEVKYGKGGQGIWQVSLIKAGALFDRIDQCDDPDAKIYSDIAHFKDGLKRAWCATEWEVMR